MSGITIEPGLVVVADGRVCKVRRIVSGNKIAVVSQREGEEFTVSLDELEFIPSSTPNGVAVVSLEVERRAANASPEEIAIARKRFDTIHRYLAGEVVRGEALVELGVSESHFYRLTKSYNESAGFCSLLRGVRGGQKGGTKFTETIEEIIEKNIDKYYKGGAASVSKVAKEVWADCDVKGLRHPSRTAIRARVKLRGERELHQRKYGTESAEQNHKSRTGKHITSRALEWVQMDHTRVDVFIVDEEKRLPIARPWVTILIDLYTRVVLGYYLALHAPSAVSVACAIFHAALPKFSFMDRMGLDGEKYPFYGVPSTIHMDNAKEFKSVKFVSACEKNNITPRWRPPGRKHYGGHVERLIGTFMTSKVHFLPGSTYSNVIQRGQYDSEKSSAMTFKEFSKWFAREVCVYHAQRHSNLKCSPAAAWRRCFDSGDGVSLHPPIVTNPFKFKMDFMPEKYRNIGREGIKINGHVYWDSTLSAHVGRAKVTVKYDPFSLKTIWVLLDDEYMPVHFANSTIADLTLAEHRARNRQGKYSGKTPVGGLEDSSLATYMKANHELVDESKRLTKRARVSEAARKEYIEGQRQDLANSEPVNSDAEALDRPNYAKRATPFKGKNYD